MNTKVEKLENSMVKLTIEVGAELFEKGLQQAYNQNKGKMFVQGFRKGKAPKHMLEKVYGEEVFYEDAANFVIPDAYDAAVEESGLEVVSRPNIDVEQIGKGKNFIFTAEVAVKPEIVVNNYKGVEVSRRDQRITEDDILAEIEKVREQNARIIDVTDRAVIADDEVVIDYEGFIDGVAFEGGKGLDHSLKIGSHSFIDTFEDQLIGTSIGDNVAVNVMFPETYHSEALQGKPALFQVNIKAIKATELPDIDDEFAQDVSEFDTLDEYKKSIQETIKEEKEHEAKHAKQDEVLGKITESVEISIPKPMLELEAENMTHEFAYRLKSQGLDLEKYFQYTGQNMANLKEHMMTEAAHKIKVRLVLEAITKAEGFVLSDEEYDVELQKMAEQYNIGLEQLMGNIGPDEKESIIQDILNQKAIDLITDTAIEV